MEFLINSGIALSAGAARRSWEYVMELVGEYTFAAPRERVWQQMLDPVVLKGCLPGCEKLELIGEDEYEATMKIGIAMIKGTFAGTVKIFDKIDNESYTMAIQGSGPQGQVKGAGKLEFVEDGEKTIVKYHGTADVSGTIARVGARMIQPAAKSISGQFFKCAESKIESGS